MTRRILCTLFVAAAVLSGLRATGAPNPLKFEAGIGYEFLSQEYFIDSLEQDPNADELDVATALTTTYLDDLRGQVRLRYLPRLDNRVDLSATFEQTPEVSRYRLNSDLRPHLGAATLYWRGELDVRHSIEEHPDPGDSYVSANSRLKLMLPISGKSDLWGEVRTDFVDFDSTSNLGFNHHRFGASTGYLLELGSFSQFGFDFFYVERRVPDSTELAYKNPGLEADLLTLYGSGDLSLYGRLEKKDYDAPDDEDDYLRIEFEARNKIQLPHLLFTRQELTLETQDYSANSLLDNSYSKTKLDLLVGWDNYSVSIGAGPHLEYLYVSAVTETDMLTDGSIDLTSEDYLETGLRVDFDYISPGATFLTIETVLGRRNQFDESELYSDFNFLRLDLLADWQLIRGLSFNSLFSADFEWHKHSDENNRTYLLSTFLSYKL